MQVAHQMGHSKIETTKNIYGAPVCLGPRCNPGRDEQPVRRLYAYEKPGNEAEEIGA